MKAFRTETTSRQVLKRNGQRLVKLLAGAIVALQFVPIWCPSFAKPLSKQADGQKIFQQYCASCHVGGGNRVTGNHPVAGSSQLSNLAIFKNYLSAPPGHMPYYQSIVKDKKTLQALYDYCKKLPEPPIDSACREDLSNFEQH